jgi:hypothetical protein
VADHPEVGWATQYKGVYQDLSDSCSLEDRSQNYSARSFEFVRIAKVRCFATWEANS